MAAWPGGVATGVNSKWWLPFYTATLRIRASNSPSTRPALEARYQRTCRALVRAWMASGDSVETQYVRGHPRPSTSIHINSDNVWMLRKARYIDKDQLKVLVGFVWYVVVGFFIRLIDNS